MSGGRVAERAGAVAPDGATVRRRANAAGVRALWQRLREARGGAAPWSPATERIPEPASDRPEVEFAGYAEDCRVFGFLQLDADRLADTLNAHDQYVLVDAIAIGLEDGRAIEAGEMTVYRDELLAVRATGPRGNSARRARVRPFPITMRTGPYTVHGYVHTLPGADPILSVRRRKPIVPITEAWIEYASASEYQRGRVGTLLVNRELVDWMALSDDEEVRLPDLPPEANPGRLVKDFTGYILTQPK